MGNTLVRDHRTFSHVYNQTHSDVALHQRRVLGHITLARREGQTPYLTLVYRDAGRVPPIHNQCPDCEVVVSRQGTAMREEVLQLTLVDNDALHHTAFTIYDTHHTPHSVWFSNEPEDTPFDHTLPNAINAVRGESIAHTYANLALALRTMPFLDIYEQPTLPIQAMHVCTHALRLTQRHTGPRTFSAGNLHTTKRFAPTIAVVQEGTDEHPQILDLHCTGLSPIDLQGKYCIIPMGSDGTLGLYFGEEQPDTMPACTTVRNMTNLDTFADTGAFVAALVAMVGDIETLDATCTNRTDIPIEGMGVVLDRYTTQPTPDTRRMYLALTRNVQSAWFYLRASMTVGFCNLLHDDLYIQLSSGTSIHVNTAPLNRHGQPHATHEYRTQNHVVLYNDGPGDRDAMRPHDTPYIDAALQIDSSPPTYWWIAELTLSGGRTPYDLQVLEHDAGFSDVVMPIDTSTAQDGTTWQLVVDTRHRDFARRDWHTTLTLVSTDANGKSEINHTSLALSFLQTPTFTAQHHAQTPYKVIRGIYAGQPAVHIPDLPTSFPILHVTRQGPRPPESTLTPWHLGTGIAWVVLRSQNNYTAELATEGGATPTPDTHTLANAITYQEFQRTFAVPVLHEWWLIAFQTVYAQGDYIAKDMPRYAGDDMRVLRDMRVVQGFEGTRAVTQVFHCRHPTTDTMAAFQPGSVVEAGYTTAPHALDQHVQIRYARQGTQDVMTWNLGTATWTFLLRKYTVMPLPHHQTLGVWWGREHGQPPQTLITQTTYQTKVIVAEGMSTQDMIQATAHRLRETFRHLEAARGWTVGAMPHIVHVDPSLVTIDPSTLSPGRHTLDAAPVATVRVHTNIVATQHGNPMHTYADMAVRCYYVQDPQQTHTAQVSKYTFRYGLHTYAAACKDNPAPIAQFTVTNPLPNTPYVFRLARAQDIFRVEQRNTIADVFIRGTAPTGDLFETDGLGEWIELNHVFPTPTTQPNQVLHFSRVQLTGSVPRPITYTSHTSWTAARDIATPHGTGFGRHTITTNPAYMYIPLSNIGFVARHPSPRSIPMASPPMVAYEESTGTWATRSVTRVAFTHTSNTGKMHEAQLVIPPWTVTFHAHPNEPIVDTHTPFTWTCVLNTDEPLFPQVLDAFMDSPLAQTFAISGPSTIMATCPATRERDPEYPVVSVHTDVRVRETGAHDTYTRTTRTFESLITSPPLIMYTALVPNPMLRMDEIDGTTLGTWKLLAPLRNQYLWDNTDERTTLAEYNSTASTTLQPNATPGVYPLHTVHIRDEPDGPTFRNICGLRVHNHVLQASAPWSIRHVAGDTWMQWDGTSTLDESNITAERGDIWTVHVRARDDTPTACNTLATPDTPLDTLTKLRTFLVARGLVATLTPRDVEIGDVVHLVDDLHIRDLTTGQTIYEKADGASEYEEDIATCTITGGYPCLVVRVLEHGTSPSWISVRLESGAEALASSAWITIHSTPSADHTITFAQIGCEEVNTTSRAQALHGTTLQLGTLRYILQDTQQDPTAYDTNTISPIPITVQPDDTAIGSHVHLAILNAIPEHLSPRVELGEDVTHLFSMYANGICTQEGRDIKPQGTEGKVSIRFAPNAAMDMAPLSRTPVPTRYSLVAARAAPAYEELHSVESFSTALCARPRFTWSDLRTSLAINGEPRTHALLGTVTQTQPLLPFDGYARHGFQLYGADTPQQWGLATTGRWTSVYARSAIRRRLEGVHASIPVQTHHGLEEGGIVIQCQGTDGNAITDSPRYLAIDGCDTQWVITTDPHTLALHEVGEHNVVLVLVTRDMSDEQVASHLADAMRTQAFECHVHAQPPTRETYTSVHITPYLQPRATAYPWPTLIWVERRDGREYEFPVPSPQTSLVVYRPVDIAREPTASQALVQKGVMHLMEHEWVSEGLQMHIPIRDGYGTLTITSNHTAPITYTISARNYRSAHGPTVTLPAPDDWVPLEIPEWGTTESRQVESVTLRCVGPEGETVIRTPRLVVWSDFTLHPSVPPILTIYLDTVTNHSLRILTRTHTRGGIGAVTPTSITQHQPSTTLWKWMNGEMVWRGAPEGEYSMYLSWGAWTRPLFERLTIVHWTPTTWTRVRANFTVPYQRQGSVVVPLHSIPPTQMEVVGTHVGVVRAEILWNDAPAITQWTQTEMGHRGHRYTWSGVPTRDWHPGTYTLRWHEQATLNPHEHAWVIGSSTIRVANEVLFEGSTVDVVYDVVRDDVLCIDVPHDMVQHWSNVPKEPVDDRRVFVVCEDCLLGDGVEVWKAHGSKRAYTIAIPPSFFGSGGVWKLSGTLWTVHMGWDNSEHRMVWNSSMSECTISTSTSRAVELLVSALDMVPGVDPSRVAPIPAAETVRYAPTRWLSEGECMFPASSWATHGLVAPCTVVVCATPAAPYVAGPGLSCIEWRHAHQPNRSFSRIDIGAEGSDPEVLHLTSPAELEHVSGWVTSACVAGTQAVLCLYRGIVGALPLRTLTFTAWVPPPPPPQVPCGARPWSSIDPSSSWPDASTFSWTVEDVFGAQGFAHGLVRVCVTVRMHDERVDVTSACEWSSGLPASAARDGYIYLAGPNATPDDVLLALHHLPERGGPRPVGAWMRARPWDEHVLEYALHLQPVYDPHTADARWTTVPFFNPRPLGYPHGMRRENGAYVQCPLDDGSRVITAVPEPWGTSGRHVSMRFVEYVTPRLSTLVRACLAAHMVPEGVESGGCWVTHFPSAVHSITPSSYVAVGYTRGCVEEGHTIVDVVASAVSDIPALRINGAEFSALPYETVDAYAAALAQRFEGEVVAPRTVRLPTPRVEVLAPLSMWEVRTERMWGNDAYVMVPHAVEDWNQHGFVVREGAQDVAYVLVRGSVHVATAAHAVEAIDLGGDWNVVDVLEALGERIAQRGAYYVTATPTHLLLIPRAAPHATDAPPSPIWPGKVRLAIHNQVAARDSVLTLDLSSCWWSTMWGHALALHNGVDGYDVIRWGYAREVGVSPVHSETTLEASSIPTWIDALQAALPAHYRMSAEGHVLTFATSRVVKPLWTSLSRAPFAPPTWTVVDNRVIWDVSTATPGGACVVVAGGMWVLTTAPDVHVPCAATRVYGVDWRRVLLRCGEEGMYSRASRPWTAWRAMLHRRTSFPRLVEGHPWIQDIAVDVVEGLVARGDALHQQ